MTDKATTPGFCLTFRELVVWINDTFNKDRKRQLGELFVKQYGVEDEQLKHMASNLDAYRYIVKTYIVEDF